MRQKSTLFSLKFYDDVSDIVERSTSLKEQSYNLYKRGDPGRRYNKPLKNLPSKCNIYHAINCHKGEFAIARHGYMKRFELTKAGVKWMVKWTFSWNHPSNRKLSSLICKHHRWRRIYCKMMSGNGSWALNTNNHFNQRWWFKSAKSYRKLSSTRLTN